MHSAPPVSFDCHSCSVCMPRMLDPVMKFCTALPPKKVELQFAFSIYTVSVLWENKDNKVKQESKISTKYCELIRLRVGICSCRKYRCPLSIDNMN